MYKKQRLKILKICAVMFAVLCMVIGIVALLDPNLRNILDDSRIYVSSTETQKDESSKAPEVVSKGDKTSSENKKDTSDKESSRNEYAEVILRNPNKKNDTEYCIECNGTGTIICPSCNGAGTANGSACMICYGNGKTQCDYCQ